VSDSPARGSRAPAIWAPDIHQDNGAPLYHAPDISALLRDPLEAYPDACLLPYVCDPPRRLGVADRDAPDVSIAWIPIDLDGPAKHHPELRGSAEQEQWLVRHVELAESLPARAGIAAPAVWASRSGLRLLWRATIGSVTPRDYNARCAAFLDRLQELGFDGIDVTSAQWTRLQRLPHGGDVIGEPGLLVLPSAPEGTAALATVIGDPTGPVTETVLFRMFEAAEIPIGDVDECRAKVCCPWDEEHSGRESPTYDALSGRAVILADVAGLGMGVFKCQHAHCSGRSNRDVLALLGAESPAAKAVLDEHDANNGRLAESLLAGGGEDTAPPAVQEAIREAESDPAGALADWHFRIQKKPKGGVVQSAHNLQATLELHPEWKGVFGWDELACEVYVLRDAPIDGLPAPGQRWTADQYFPVLTWFEHRLQIKPPAGELCDAIQHVAKLRGAFHPVRDYLRDCRARWDGRQRSLVTYLGAESNEYHHAVVGAWLRSAVARVMRPGCKADNVLILEGPQGAYKSTTIRALTGDDWFYEAAGADIGDKDFAQSMRGKWIGEIPEIDRLIASKDESTLKAMLSKVSDRYRPSYGRASLDFPRQTVFAGTTNRDDYLRDETGNRRYWPVACGTIDLDGIRRDRDQIWGQVTAEFEAGEPWWIARDLERVAAAVQAERLERDIWEGAIREWALEQATKGNLFTTLEALAKLPGAKAGADLGQGDKNRMGRLLRALGLESKPGLQRDGVKGWYWRRKE
jgi:hypothetical protein